MGSLSCARPTMETFQAPKTKEEWMDSAKEQLGLDDVEVGEVLKMFFQELPQQLLSMNFDKEDIKAQKRYAHSMKSSTLMLVMTDVSEVAKDLETAFGSVEKKPDDEAFKAETLKDKHEKIRTLCNLLAHYNTILQPQDGFDPKLWLEVVEMENFSDAAARQSFLQERLSDPLPDIWKSILEGF